VPLLFDVSRTQDKGDSFVHVRGELDLATRDLVTLAVQDALQDRPATLYVDLTHTRFCDSAGARALVTATRLAQEHGTEFFLLCPLDNKPVRRVLELLQLERVVHAVVAAPRA
jgi:anti-anti-sigma factor